jgi:hypothetical protein
MKTILIFLALILLPQHNAFGQDEFEIAATAMTLTRLSVKAQEDRDASSLIVYQNAWLELKEDYPNMADHPTFVQTNQFFNQVNEAYTSSVGIISYNMDGLNDVVLPDAGADIAVVDAPLGWSYSWQMPDCDETFGSGDLKLEDIQVMKAVLNSNSKGDPIQLDAKQIDRVSKYYDQLSKSIFINSKDKTYSNVDNFKSKDLSKLKKYRKERIEFKQINTLQQLELTNPNGTTPQQRARARELNRIKTSLQRINTKAVTNDGG